MHWSWFSFVIGILVTILVPVGVVFVLAKLHSPEFDNGLASKK